MASTQNQRIVRRYELQLVEPFRQQDAVDKEKIEEEIKKLRLENRQLNSSPWLAPTTVIGALLALVGGGGFFIQYQLMRVQLNEAKAELHEARAELKESKAESAEAKNDRHDALEQKARADAEKAKAERDRDAAVFATTLKRTELDDLNKRFAIADAAKAKAESARDAAVAAVNQKKIELDDLVVRHEKAKQRYQQLIDRVGTDDNVERPVGAGSEVTIEGMVTNDARRPIEGATVQATRKGTKSAATMTDRAGHFRFQLPKSNEDIYLLIRGKQGENRFIRLRGDVSHSATYLLEPPLA